jgi:hypothetical protein
MWLRSFARPRGKAVALILRQSLGVCAAFGCAVGCGEGCVGFLLVGHVVSPL